MAITQTIKDIWSQGGGTPLSATVSQTGSAVKGVSIDIANGAVDQEIDIALTVANALVVFLLSTQALTIKTNSTSAPDQTIPVKANVPIPWHKDSFFSCPFTTNLTKLFVSNASGASARLELRILTS